MTPQDRLRRDLVGSAIKGGVFLLIGFFVYPFLRFIGFTIKPKPRRILINKALDAGGYHANPDFFLFSDEKGPIAVSRTCTHLGCKLNYRFESKLLICPCHRSEFSIDGRRTNGPAKKDLTVFPVDTQRDEAGVIIGYVVTLS